MPTTNETTLGVIMDDGTRYSMTEPTPADLIAWERYARTRGIPLDAAPSIEQVAYLVYTNARRNDTTLSCTFDEFVDRVAEFIMPEDGAEPADPTPGRPGPSAE